MPNDYDVKLDGFKELEQQLYALESGEVIDNIQRSALRAAGNVIKPALITATPTRKTAALGKEALPEGALKAAVRMVTHIPHDGTPPSVTVDHGKLNYIARFVDQGHINANAKTGRTHTPAYPFIRGVEAETQEAATDAYLTTLEVGINTALKGK